ncbi:MAG: phospholipid carrier-dependent glycosyltransferase [Anaerolineae bacterium]|nr:phospholipid carrier-dependent glycosyltransferase [Anaerolineae bacterium]
MEGQKETTTGGATRRVVWGVVASLVVAWAFAVYFAYYIVHKPFDLTVALALVDRVTDVVAWAAILLVATALGQRVLRSLGFDSPLEELILAAGAGLGFVSLLILALGLAGGLHRWLVYVLALAACLVLRRDLGRTLRVLGSLTRPPLPSPLDRLLIGYVLLALGLALLFCLTPPVDWDGQAYHLTGPKLFIELGRITGGIDIPYLGFPSLLEMLFLAGMLLKSDIVAKLVHFAYGALTVGLLYSFARRHLRAQRPWLASAIYLSAPSIVLISTWAYVDLGVAFYTFAAFYGFVTWTELRDNRWLALTGIVSGFALGVKYTSVLTPIVLGLLLIWELRRDRIAPILRQLSIFCLPAAALACPWYLKNWALTGNPFYPFFFGGHFWDEFRAWWFSRWGTGLLHEPLRLLGAPWEMTVMGVEGKLGYQASIGPVLLACLPLVLVALLRTNDNRRTKTLLYAVVLGGSHYLLWLGGVAQSELLRQTRLLFPIFPVLAMLASVGLERLSVLDVKGFSSQRFVLLALALALCLNALSFLVSLGADNPSPFILGMETRDQFLERHLGDYYRAISYVNEELPPSAKVLFLWEPRSYYCRVECLPDAILDRFMHLRYRYGDAEGIAEHLRTQGISHVLFYKAGFEQIVAAQFDPIRPEDLETLRALQNEYWEPLEQISGSYQLYRVR